MALPQFTTGTIAEPLVMNAMVNDINENTSAIGQNTSDLNAHKADLVTDADGAHGLKVEEGTWTPILGALTTNGTHTYTTQNGYYYRVGNKVTAFFSLVLTKGAGIAGAVKISGLPFISAPPSKVYYSASGSLVAFSGLAFSPGYSQLGLTAVPSASYIEFRENGSNVQFQPFFATSLGANVELYGYVEYII